VARARAARQVTLAAGEAADRRAEGDHSGLLSMAEMFQARPRPSRLL
jgi:hypothetical protein